MKTSSPEDADLIVQKLRCDGGIHRNARKGTLNAPGAVLEDFKFSQKVLVDEVFPDEFSLEETQRRIEENTREMAGYGKPILSIGGDHSVSFPVLKALKQQYPGLQLVWLDAHPDLKAPVNGHVSHDVAVRELVEQEVFDGEEVWIAGVTRTDGDEEDFLEEHEIRVYRPEEIDKFLREFNPGEQPVYLSVDIDVLAGVEGTGYPDGELEVEEVKKTVEEVGPAHADLVEVAPPLDQGETVSRSRDVFGALEEAVNNR